MRGSAGRSLKGKPKEKANPPPEKKTERKRQEIPKAQPKKKIEPPKHRPLPPRRRAEKQDPPEEQIEKEEEVECPLSKKELKDWCANNDLRG